MRYGFHNKFSLDIPATPNGAVANKNIHLITGSSGSGKGQYLKNEIPNMLKNGVMVCVFDPLNEYGTLIADLNCGSSVRVCNKIKDGAFMKTFERMCKAIAGDESDKPFNVIIEEFPSLCSTEVEQIQFMEVVERMAALRPNCHFFVVVQNMKYLLDTIRPLLMSYCREYLHFALSHQMGGKPEIDADGIVNFTYECYESFNEYEAAAARKTKSHKNLMSALFGLGRRSKAVRFYSRFYSGDGA